MEEVIFQSHLIFSILKWRSARDMVHFYWICDARLNINAPYDELKLKFIYSYELLGRMKLAGLIKRSHCDFPYYIDYVEHPYTLWWLRSEISSAISRYNDRLIYW